MSPPPFEVLLPEIEERSRRHYGHIAGADHDERVQESVCQAFALYRSAIERGNYRFTPCTLTWYANRAVDEGRRFAGYTKTDALDRASSLDAHPLDAWNLPDALIERRTPVDQQARIIIDWPAFMETLPKREAGIVEDIAAGSTRAEVARALGLSPARITQLMATTADAYEERFGTPGFEVRARKQEKRKRGRQPARPAAAA